MVTNRNKKRPPKYSQKRKEIGTDEGASKGLEMGTKTEHRNGCQKETSKVIIIIIIKNGSNKNRDCRNEICGKGRPLSRHPMTPLFSSFYNAFSHEILILIFFFFFFFFCALREV